MRARAAGWLNAAGNRAQTAGHERLARILYGLSTKSAPNWSVPWYNLGLEAKYRADWAASYTYNEKAASLDPSDEASWWNLAIAATALRKWAEARRAWIACGIELAESGDEVFMPEVTACVRLDPQSHAEVVWGTRLDPARIRILNVPLPTSGRRYRDIILNDGAENGIRTSGNHSYPVLDELAVWEASPYSTFRVNLAFSNSDENAEAALRELCEDRDVGSEDWSTIRNLCATCSRGNPGEHQCADDPVPEGEKRYGFAATSRDAVISLLEEWAGDQRSFTPPTLELLAPIN